MRAGGGGCFPMHYDSDEEVDGRRVTAICYLNPRWRAGDGGEVSCGCFQPILLAANLQGVALTPLVLATAVKCDARM